MSAERHARIKALFHEALDRPRVERQAFLQEACGDDESLLEEVREMLAVEDGSPDFLDTTVVADELSSSAAIPDYLGPFRVIRRIGEGGMGAVYEAEQERPRRRVALKVLHPGLGNSHMLRRFELESEVLGRLGHPGIARVYEAGSSDAGRGAQPWFAMELVEGKPLTDYCSDRDLALEQRLKLIAEVCDAVHHAHQRGIVHRDLKPGNVLVDANGQPKVLDFGIARATDAELQATLRTDPGMIIGTLQYMSPEQATADPDALDVRADVYSIGVMLYELVAGRPPLDLGRLPMHEALRRVLEVEPDPLRSTEQRVPVDVAVITHKALEKDKQRRYGTAAELADDLRRFLRREPISAQPPSTWYRLRRFAARNKVLVGGAAATLAALVTGLAIALWQRDTAREALARAEGINRFLLTDLLASPSPERLGRDVRVVDVLAPAARAAERTFASQPRVAAEVLDAVGASYHSLGLPEEAEPLTRRALELLGEDATDPLALRARAHLVQVLTDLDRAEDAVAIGEAAVAEATRTYGADDPETLALRTSLAVARWDAGQPERSLNELRDVARTKARVLGEEDTRTLATSSQLAVNLAAIGEIREGRDLLRATLETQERVLGPEHPGAIRSRSHLAWILTLGSAWEDAESIYADLLPVLESVYGSDHPYTARVRVDMAQCPLHLDRIEDAEELVRTAVADLESRVGKQHSWTLQARLMLAEVFFRRGDHAEAVAEASRAVELLRSTVTAEGETFGHALAKLGRCHQEAGDLRAAAAAFREAADVYRGAFDRPNDYLAQMLYNLGVVLRDAGELEAAIEALEQAMELDARLWGPDHSHVLSDRFNLARTLLAAGRPEAAVTQMRANVASAESQEIDPGRLLDYRALLGEALLEAGQLEEAGQVLRAVLAGYDELGMTDDSEARRARDCLTRLQEQR